MSKRPRMDDALAVLDAAPSSASVVDLQDVVRALQSMQTTASTLRKKLHCGETHSSNVTEDSKTLTWPGYAERLRADQVDAGSRLLTENLYTMVSDLLATLGHGKKVRLCILIDDVLVDVFMCLGRVTLDAVQLTCRRFNALVETYLEKTCFRTLFVDITSLDFAQRDGRWKGDEPKWDSAPGMYRLTIRAEAEVEISPYFIDHYRTFIFESHNLQDIMARCEEKVLKPTYVRYMDLNGVPEVLHQIVQSHPELAAKIVIGTACFREREEDDVDALALLDQLSAFRDVNGVRLSGEVNANCEFFKRCREMGILYILFKMGQDKVSVEGLLDFFFGPTREGLENVERGVGDIEFIDEELPRRMLESIKTHGAPDHRIYLSSMNIYDEEAAKLKDELTKHYVLKKTDDKDEELYATRPLDGIEVVWRFDLQLEYVTCTVQSV